MLKNDIQMGILNTGEKNIQRVEETFRGRRHAALEIGQKCLGKGYLRPAASSGT